MITLDTSGLVAVMDRRDLQHAPSIAALEADPGPYLIPSPILAEIAYIIEVRFGHRVLDNLLQDIESDRYSLDCGDRDMNRVRQLVGQYADMPLGFADAAVVACAERRGRRVLTFDRRHFGVIARGTKIELLP